MFKNWKNIQLNNIHIFFHQIAIYLCLGLHEGLPSYRRSLPAFQRKNITHSKKFICGSLELLNWNGVACQLVWFCSTPWTKTSPQSSSPSRCRAPSELSGQTPPPPPGMNFSCSVEKSGSAEVHIHITLLLRIGVPFNMSFYGFFVRKTWTGSDRDLVIQTSLVNLWEKRNYVGERKRRNLNRINRFWIRI